MYRTAMEEETPQFVAIRHKVDQGAASPARTCHRG